MIFNYKGKKYGCKRLLLKVIFENEIDIEITRLVLDERRRDDVKIK
jgi:hypothetical protein